MPLSELKVRRAALAAFLLLAATGIVRAELKWDSKEQSVALRATDSVATAHFAFTNSGDKPVTIADVHASCGCTVPVLAKNTYAPGERGEIRADFHPGNREGTQHLAITVQTDDDGETATLTLVAQIQAVVVFDTKYVFWRDTEPRAPKVMRLTFAPDFVAQVAGVQCSSPQFTATFRPIGDTGREYEIAVTPPANVQTYTAITVRTLLGLEKTERDFTVVARTF